MEDSFSQNEINNRLDSLFNWLPTPEFRTIEAELDHAIGCRYRERRYKAWREAWVLGRLAKEMQADAARLLPPKDFSPDGEICVGGTVIEVEVTELIEEGRKPGAEPRCGSPQDDPVENWRARAESIPCQLDEAISCKAEKPYAGRAILAVYLNPGGTYGIGQKEIEGAIGDCIVKWSPGFRTVRVFWNERWYGP